MEKNIATLTATLNSPDGTCHNLTNLKETLELAEKLNIPSETLRDSYNSVETMTKRVDTVSKRVELMYL